jgi:hypothetical protein
MRTPRPIRLLKPWGVYAPGQVFTEMGLGVATTLIERGLAEYADVQVKASPVDRMMQAVRPAKPHKTKSAA